MWQVRQWASKPFAHGFFGVDLDVREGSCEWDKLFPDGPRLLLPNQVHGRDICKFSSNLNSRPMVDAWLVAVEDLKRENVALGIKTADCFPVIVYAEQIEMLVLAHCGWRGTIEGILPTALEQLHALGASIDKMELAIGPGAQACCYEISEDLALRFRKNSEELKSTFSPIREQEGRFYLNIPGFLAIQALNIGIDKGNIIFAENCTIHEKKFFSYRRQKDLSGRQLSFVCAI
jgi:YfiH family protein